MDMGTDTGKDIDTNTDMYIESEVYQDTRHERGQWALKEHSDSRSPIVCI